jgi:acyl-CoA synthetase (NDP forming)
MKSQQNRSDLKYFFEPASVAVFGSLREGMGLGYGVIRNMLQFNYAGKIYPVSPYQNGDVLGFKAYSAVEDVADPIDAAIVITPPPTVPGIVEQCARKGVKAVTIVSENFAEAGGDGIKYQQQLVDIVRRTGIRIIGPNTVGLFNAANGFITNPYLIVQKKIRKGGIAYCSQSGYVGTAAQPLEDRVIPLSKMCDVGNKCDVDEADLLNYLADDPDTRVVAMHLENVKDGRRFMDAARRVVKRKPLLILRPGRSEEAARAAASHTASLAGNEQVYDSAIKQVGAIRLDTWLEYWEVPRIFAYQQLPSGNRVAILTLTGGVAVVGVDVAVSAGLSLARFSSATADKLKKIYPRLSSNPVDLGPILSVTDNPFAVEEEVIALALNDANVDCAAVAVYAGFDDIVAPIVEMFDHLKERITKPMALWIYGMKLSAMDEMSRQLEMRGLPTYFYLETAVKALGFAARYSRTKSSRE